jgi:hypothetical protein
MNAKRDAEPVVKSASIPNRAFLLSQAHLSIAAEFEKTCACCDFDKTDGDLVNHCPACCHRITVKVGEALRRLDEKGVWTED